jgi:propanol-preferring alcohol dehydrogenase
MTTTSIPDTQTVAWIENPSPSCVLQIRDNIQVKQPAEHEVLVKMECSGICHSDCHNLEQAGIYTEIPGHEGVGKVVKLGPGASEDLLGKRVGIKWLWSACNECTSCKQGKINHCAKQLNTGRSVWGTLQQYVVAHADFVTMIPDGVKSEVAAPLLCAGLSLAGAVSKLAPEVQPGDYVAIIGAGGGLGHVGVQIATIKGYKVIAIDSGAEKEKLSREMGAVAFVDYMKQDTVKAVQDLTDGEGAHGVICVAGSEKAYQQAPALARNSGVFVCVGLPPPTFMFPMSPIHIANRGMFEFVAGVFVYTDNTGLVIRGSSTGTKAQMDELLQLALQGKITPKIEVYDFADSPKIIQELQRYEVTGRKVVRVP